MLNRKPTDGLSHVMGAVDMPLLNLTIPAMLSATATRLPDHPAAIFTAQGISWTYRAFAEKVDRLAAGFLTLGITKGDRVGIWSPNRAEWLLTQFATARIGAILVCVNPAYRKGELDYALRSVGCRAIVTAPSFKSSNYIAMLQDLIPELAAADGHLDAPHLPDLRHVIVMGTTIPQGMTGFDAVMVRGTATTAELDAISADLSPHDPINIQFTSGTTGSPKGACLTHHNIVNNAHFVTATMHFSDRDRLCIPVPFYHCFGMVMGTLGCVTKGATMVIPGEGFDPAETLRAVAQEKCTALYGVPTMFVAEMALPDFKDYNLSRLRTGIMAGAPCPIAVMRKVQADMHMSEVTIAYGMTETSPVSFQSNVDDPLAQRVTSVGRVHPHVEVKIVDDRGQIIPVGAQGELLTRGYSVMQGYWGDAAKTAASIDAEGWMHTGDLATMDAQGYCTITGRVKDMICRGGENVFPKEIEDFLFDHPAIAQAQVFGIPDPILGEVVCAWIVPHTGQPLTANDVQTFCKDQIAYFKVPTHIRIVDALPMTVTGKPQKFMMRDAMMAELGMEG